MADNHIGQLQEHINAMIAILNQVEPIVDGFIQLQRMARDAFENFDGDDPDDLPDETFNYIEAYRTLNQQIAGTQQTVQHHIGEINLAMFLNQMPDQDHLPDEEEEQYNRLIDRVLNGWHRIKNQRYRTRQFLLLGQYATEQQLEQGFDGIVPERFRYGDAELYGWPMVDNFLNWIQMILDPNQLHVPTAMQFHEIRDMGEESLEVCRAIVQEQHQQHGNLNLEQYQQLVPEDAFEYINLFEQRNNRFREHEDIIENRLEFVQRIAGEMPEVLDQEQQQLFEDLRERFQQIRERRDHVEAYLLDERMASEDQLMFGYDGEIPEEFRIGVDLQM